MRLGIEPRLLVIQGKDRVQNVFDHVLNVFDHVLNVFDH
jgi:hypothetical protein